MYLTNSKNLATLALLSTKVIFILLRYKNIERQGKFKLQRLV